MFKLYSVTKEKTNCKGFWKDNKGKIFVDNIMPKILSGEKMYFEKKLYSQTVKKRFFIFWKI